MPLSLTLQGHDSTPADVFTIQRFFLLYNGIAFVLLLWDWANNLTLETRLIFNTRAQGGFFALKYWFLASRYATLAFALFVGINWSLVHFYPESACEIARYWPFGFTLVGLTSHIVMALRVHAIYERSTKILSLFLAFAIVDLGAEFIADYYTQAVMLQAPLGQSLIEACFVMPTSTAFVVAFLVPTLYHHTILLFTLYKSFEHIRQTKSHLMATIQRDHILYVLVICLINFANLVLVVQSSTFAYKLIHQLPSMVLTQIFLSRIVFNLKNISYKERNAQFDIPPTINATNSAGSKTMLNSPFFESKFKFGGEPSPRELEQGLPSPPQEFVEKASHPRPFMLSPPRSTPLDQGSQRFSDSSFDGSTLYTPSPRKLGSTISSPRRTFRKNSIPLTPMVPSPPQTPLVISTPMVQSPPRMDLQSSTKSSIGLNSSTQSSAEDIIISDNSDLRISPPAPRLKTDDAKFTAENIGPLFVPDELDDPCFEKDCYNNREWNPPNSWQTENNGEVVAPEPFVPEVATADIPDTSTGLGLSGFLVLNPNQTLLVSNGLGIRTPSQPRMEIPSNLTSAPFEFGAIPDRYRRRKRNQGLVTEEQDAEDKA